MVFSSLSFLFFFFPLVTISYFLCKNRTYRNTILLLFSLLFYSWGEPKYLAVMIVSSGLGYLSGLLIDRYRSRPRIARGILISSVSLLLAILFYFKYLNFAADNLGKLLGVSVPVSRIALPIGISFYTFQILSYVIDLYRGKSKPAAQPIQFSPVCKLFPSADCRADCAILNNRERVGGPAGEPGECMRGIETLHTWTWEKTHPCQQCRTRF